MRSPTISAISCERWRCPRTIEPWSPTSLREKLIGAKVVSRGHYERAYACRLPRSASRNLGGNLSSCTRLQSLPAEGRPYDQASFQVSINPVEKLVGESGGEIGPSVSR